MRLELRPAPSPRAALATPLIAIALTLVSGAILFAALGRDPGEGFHAFFVQPLSSAYGVAELLLKAGPLMLIATGLAIGYRANVWNIGAEGQLVLGAIAGTGIALAFDESGAELVLPAMFLAGAVAGGAWAAIPAWLRTRFNANEILTSLMLVYIAQLLLSYLVHGPWRDPQGFNFPQSKLFADAALLAPWFEGLRLTHAFLVAIVGVAIGWVVMERSFLGFRLRVAGAAPDAARYAGFDAKRAIWVGMLAGGIAAGIAGAAEVAGPVGQLTPNVSPGYGFAAIIAAFVGRLQPVGIVFSSLLLALLYLGGESAQIALNLPAAITGVFQGMLLIYLLAADVLIRYRVRGGHRNAVA
jgi:general nucleoside transport system permease protein